MRVSEGQIRSNERGARVALVGDRWVTVTDVGQVSADGDDSGDRGEDTGHRGRKAWISRTSRNGAQAVPDDGRRDSEGNELRGRRRWIEHSVKQSRREVES